MSKTMKILLPTLIVFAVAAIAVNVYFNFFAPKPKRSPIIMEIPTKREAPLPLEAPATR